MTKMRRTQQDILEEAVLEILQDERFNDRIHTMCRTHRTVLSRVANIATEADIRGHYQLATLRKDLAKFQNRKFSHFGLSPLQKEKIKILSGTGAFLAAFRRELPLSVVSSSSDSDNHDPIPKYPIARKRTERDGEIQSISRKTPKREES